MTHVTQLCSTGCKSVARALVSRCSGFGCRRRPNRRLFRPDAFLKTVLEVGGGFGEGLRISAGLVARDAGPIERLRASKALGAHAQQILIMLRCLHPFLTGKIGVSQP